MADVWAKVWSDLPDRPKVRREVREHGGDALWLWTVCIIRAKASDSSGRIEVEKGMTATDEELRETSALSPERFTRALAVLLRWGSGSTYGWLGRDADGCLRVRNMDRRQVSAEAQRKRDQKKKGTSNGKVPGKVPGKNHADVDADVAKDAATEATLTGDLSSATHSHPAPGTGQGPVQRSPRPKKSEPVRTGTLYHVRMEPDAVTGGYRLEGITDADRAEWQEAYHLDGATLDARLQALCDHCAALPAWHRERGKSGAWVATIRSWLAGTKAPAGTARPRPNDPTRDRYGREYGSITIARELGLLEGQHGD